MTIWICRWRMNTLMTAKYRPRFTVIEYNQNFIQADHPIRFQYSNKIKLFFLSLFLLISTSFSSKWNGYKNTPLETQYLWPFMFTIWPELVFWQWMKNVKRLKINMKCYCKITNDYIYYTKDLSLIILILWYFIVNMYELFEIIFAVHIWLLLFWGPQGRLAYCC